MACAQETDLFTRILTNTDGRMLDLVLESKADGTVHHVIGTNKFLDKVPHIESNEGVIYLYARYAVRNFN